MPDIYFITEYETDPSSEVVGRDPTKPQSMSRSHHSSIRLEDNQISVISE